MNTTSTHRSGTELVDLSQLIRVPVRVPLVAPFFEMPAHLLLHQQGIVTQVHDAIRDSILETAILADHMVKVEPRGLYGERSTGGVDGLVDIIKQGPAEPSATGVARRRQYSLIAVAPLRAAAAAAA